MPRLRQVPRSADNAPIVTLLYDLVFGDRDPVAEPGTETGTRGDWWTVFANSPDVLTHAAQGFQLYQSADRVLDPVLRELAQTRIGYVAGSRFVFSQHSKSMRGLGISEARIAAIPSWQASPEFSDLERLVLAFADCVGLAHGRVPDAIFDPLLNELGDEAMLELTYITTMYFQHAVMSRVLRTEYDDIDEPLVEVLVDGADDTIVTLPSGG